MLMQTRLPVQGMSCGHCEGRVNKAVGAMPGVHQVHASSASHHVLIAHEPSVTVAEISAVVLAAGYEADAGGAVTEPDADPEPEPEPEPPAAQLPSTAGPAPDAVPGNGAHARLDVSGMSCASCVATIDRTLASFPGVTSASVNLLLHRADVDYDPLVTDPHAIVAAVTALGYPATIALPASVFEARTVVHSLTYRPADIAWTLAVGVLTMALPMSWLHGPDGNRWRWWLLVAVTSVVVGSSRSTFQLAWAAIRRGATDMHVLVALGAGVAWLASAVVTMAPAWAVAHGLPHEGWFDAVPWVLGLTALGRWLEERAKRRTTDALGALTALQPLVAHVIRDGRETEQPLAHVLAGDLVRVRPGERVPVDGVVVEGASALDASLLTGETLPHTVGVGDRVTGGTQNLDGALLIRALAVGEHSALAHMLRMVEDAQTTRPAVQRLADRVAGYLTPVVLGIALLTVVGWWLFGGHDGLQHGLSSAIAVLVIACPCAMGLAVPTSIMVAVGRAAQLGILVRTGATLERGHAVTAVILDKTGTLTTGKPQVMAVVDAPDAPPTWRHALVSAQRLSGHPLAQAIVAWAPADLRDGPISGEFQNVAGQGVVYRMTNGVLWAGRPEWLSAQGVDLAPLAETLADPRYSVVAAAIDGRLAGVVTLHDPVRPTSAAAVAALRGQGVDVWLASGDRQAVVASAAQEVGATSFLAAALPADKVALIQRLQAQGQVVAMVGDGVNDAPALAQADVGVAMGAGTDVAAAAADFVLVRNDLAVVPDALALCAATMRNIHMNLGWALGFNLIAVPVAAGVLWPLTHWLLPPMFGSLAMALSSVTVVTNALRLQHWHPPRYVTNRPHLPR